MEYTEAEASPSRSRQSHLYRSRPTRTPIEYHFDTPRINHRHTTLVHRMLQRSANYKIIVNIVATAVSPCAVEIERDGVCGRDLVHRIVRTVRRAQLREQTKQQINPIPCVSGCTRCRQWHGVG